MQILQLRSGAEFYLDGLIVECILGNLRTCHFTSLFYTPNFFSLNSSVVPP